jgi:hypothetical protein
MYHGNENKCNVPWNNIYLYFRDIKILIARWTLTNTGLNNTFIFPKGERLKQVKSSMPAAVTWNSSVIHPYAGGVVTY